MVFSCLLFLALALALTLALVHALVVILVVVLEVKYVMGFSGGWGVCVSASARRTHRKDIARVERLFVSKPKTKNHT